MSSKIMKIILYILSITSFLFTALHFLPAYSADSRPSNWALAEVEWFKDNGYADSSFFSDYQKPLTRQEAAMLFVKAYDFFAPGSSAVQTGEDAYPFTDRYAPEYRDYIEKAYELGIIKGYGDNTFGALNPVTREQMSVMIVRFLDKLAPGEFDYDKYSSYVSDFADDKDISVWAKGPLLYLNHMGIIRGVSGNRIDPKGYVTREQAMVIVNRLMTNGGILLVLQSNVDSKDVYVINSYDDLKKVIVSALMNGVDKIYLNSADGYKIKNENVVNLFLQHDMYASSIEYGSVGDVYYIKFDYGIGEKEIKETISKAHDIISQIVKPGMTDYEKELAIHDYIVTHTQYDYDNFLNNTVPEESYTAYGVLVKGTGVCQGYAAAMHMLLNMAGINTIIVTGTAKDGSSTQNHAWNIVEVGGRYYHVDATWDDPVTQDGQEILSHQYFNLNDNEMSKDHYWDRSVYPQCK